MGSLTGQKEEAEATCQALCPVLQAAHGRGSRVGAVLALPLASWTWDAHVSHFRHIGLGPMLLFPEGSRLALLPETEEVLFV